MNIRGGLHLDGHKSRPLERPIATLPAPEVAVLALDQGSGAESRPVVVPGARVRVGTLLASADGAAASLHSPVSGVVREISMQPTPRGTGRCIVIDSDGSGERAAGLAPVDWTALGGTALLAHIAAAGTAGLGGGAFPTAEKLALARSAGVQLLLLNGAECEPRICCDDALMREHAGEVLSGARIMLAACGARECVIAVEDDKPAAIAALQSALAAVGDQRIELKVLPALFPLGAEGPLVTALTGHEVPHDGWPPQVGVVCQNVGTAAAVARLYASGMPVTRRIVTVTGSGVARPANVDACIGTPVHALIEACGGRAVDVTTLVAGGSFTGRTLATDAAPVTKGLNCVLVATAADLPARGPEMPCIRCGDCAVVCPAGLLPQQLHLAALADDPGAIDRLGLAACIECGCCDFVCPSAIPLTAEFRGARARRHLREVEQQRALAARARFERHQRRLAEQEEAERRAFEEARRGAGASGAEAD